MTPSLNQDGTVAEATGENVFFVKGKELVTNDATSSILPGLTRDTVLTLAAEANIVTRVRAFTRDELMAADEVFLTGTAAEVTPVREIDGRQFRTGPPPSAPSCRRPTSPSSAVTTENTPTG